MKFEGYDPKAISFLKSLKRNNRREWFQPRKEKYEELIKFPTQDLISDLAVICAKDLPNVIFDPKKSLYRIYRDVRFSNDKSPYKTHVAASFALRGAGKKSEGPGYYFHVEPGEVFVGAGVYMPSSEQTRKFRAFVIEHSKEYLAVVNSKSFKKNFGEIQGDKLKTTPRGIDENHPMIEHLKHKQFFIHCTLPEKDAFNPMLPQKVAKKFIAMKDFVEMLEKAFALW